MATSWLVSRRQIGEFQKSLTIFTTLSLFSASACLYAPNANAVPIFSGYVSGSYELFDADIDPVGILLDDGSTINSGQVKFELDPNKTSFFKFDFDKMTH